MFSFPLIRRIGSIAAALTLVAAAVPRAAEAQLAPAPIDSAIRRDPCAPTRAPTAHYLIAPYGWLLGIRGETGVRDLSADVHITFDDLLRHLQFAAMGEFEFSYNHWLGIVDGLWASVKDDKTASVGHLTPDIDMNARIAIFQAFGGYSFRARSNLAIDALAGGRLWGVDLSLRLVGEDIARQRERNPTWGEALGGLRVRWEPAERWYVSASGDGGGGWGHSRGTGEGMGTIGYDVSRRWNVFGAYRYLYEDYRKNDYFFKGHISGPVIGGRYRW